MLTDPQRDTSKPFFDKDGAIGRHFRADGAIGKVAEKLGGAFAHNGRIGRMFNPDGAIGERVNRTAGQG